MKEHAEVSFPHQLKLERIHRAWSQARLAGELGTDNKTVSRWERGVSLPASYLREKLCGIFGKTAQELGLIENEEKFSFPFLLDPALPPKGLFVGRQKELEALKCLFLSQQAEQVIISTLNGLPGIGKTTLAIHLAYEPEIQAHFHHGILWAELGPTPQVRGHLSRWGRLLALSPTEEAKPAPAEDWLDTLRFALGRRQMLIVIDDVWRLEDVFALQVGGASCAYLLTSRFPDIALHFSASSQFVIHEFSEQESMELLRTLAQEATAQEEKKVYDLVQAVGRLPLALTLMGNYLRKQTYSGQSRRIHTALQHLSDAKVRLSLSEPPSPLESHPSLPSNVPLSLQSVIAVTDQHLSEVARAAYYALAVFPTKPHSFSEEAALFVANCTGEALDALVGASLLESTRSGRYILHQVLADYACIYGAKSIPYERFITYAMLYTEKHKKDYELLEQEESIILKALEITHQRNKQKELIQFVLDCTPFLLSRGFYQSAERHLQRAREACILQADDRNLARVLFYLGQVALRQGTYLQSMALFQEGVMLARQVKDHEQLCTLLAHLGWVAWKNGKLVQAEVYLREGLALARRFDYQEQAGIVLSILGLVAESQGNYAQAEALIQESIALASQTGDREQRCVLLIEMGVILAVRGEFARGEQALQKALNIARQLGHREWTIVSLLKLGDLLVTQREYAQARTLFLEGLALARQIRHQEWIGALLIGLGTALSKEKPSQAEEAERSFQEGFVLLRQLQPSASLAKALYAYGNFLLERPQDHSLLEQARATFQEMLTCIPAKEKNLLMLAWYGLARVAAMQGDREQAHHYGAMSLQAMEETGHYLAREASEWFAALS